METVLKQILNELQVMRTDVSGMKQDVSGLKKDVNVLKEDVSELKQGFNRLEKNQEKMQKNFIDTIAIYKNKIVQHFDDNTEALNKRVYKLESNMERISRR